MLGSIIIGAIVGVVARLVSSSRAPGGFITSTLLGIAGALLSGFVGHGLGFYGASGPGLLFSLIGSLLLLWLHRTVTSGRRREALASGPSPQARSTHESVGASGSASKVPANSVLTPTSAEPIARVPHEAGGSDIGDDKAKPPSVERPPDVFLSYATADRPHAQALALALSASGLRVWWDRTIPPGRTFDEVIEGALDSARCVIVLWSRASVASNWVKAEASEGQRRGVLVPALLEEVRIPLEFRRIQTADLSDWRLSPDHQGFQNLVKSVIQVTGLDVGQEQP